MVCFLEWVENEVVKEVVTSLTERYCYNCVCWKWSGVTSSSGYCSLYSVSCITAVFNHEKPPRFLSMDLMKGGNENV